MITIPKTLIITNNKEFIASYYSFSFSITSSTTLISESEYSSPDGCYSLFLSSGVYYYPLSPVSYPFPTSSPSI